MDRLDLPELDHCTDAEARELCARLRTFLIESVAQTGGHLASNLGAVELTVAIHRVFDTGRDRLVFDVGHQCYTHKILTGRQEAMNTLRTFGGLAGFPKPVESEHDAFIAGHASNSVSVALGMARARTLRGEDYHVLALIGDGALTGGLSYEGLSDAGQSGEPLIILLNDNGMSITKNVGGVSQHLAQQRLKPQYLRFKRGYRKVMSVLPLGNHIYRFTHKVKKAIKETMLPSSMFENMGFTYLGPVDGHDVKLITRMLRYAKEECNGPVILHIRTVKGKGYTPAERNPDAFHGVSQYRVSDGMPLKQSGTNFSASFGASLCRLAENEPRVCAITAAMQTGTGLDQFSKQYPNRFFDVGIAEGHAVTMASGMAKQGMIPVFAVYSSFLQRSYDMLVHDVAIQGLHVVLAVDRGGLVGDDGETHHGLFDVAFLDTIPGMTVLAPASYAELDEMLSWAVKLEKGPVAIHYPRGSEGGYTGKSDYKKSACLKEGKGITLVTYGTMINAVLEASQLLEQQGISADVIKLNQLSPLDITPIAESVRKTGRLLVAEEGIAMNSVGRRVAALLAESGQVPKAMVLRNTGSGFVPHGSVAELRKLCGLDGESLYRAAREVCGRE